MLPHAGQRSCLAAAARHLRPGGTLFIEAFRFDPRRFDADGQRTEHRHSQAGTHTVHSRHDPAARTISITHVLGEQDGAGQPERLDLPARAFGFCVGLGNPVRVPVHLVREPAGSDPQHRRDGWGGVSSSRLRARR
jgi:hypothetical protein